MKMTGDKLLLFVVETVSTCQSDEYYLNYFIKKSGFFDVGSWKNASIQFVYLNGKTNYKSDRIKDEIVDKWNGFASKNKHLIFVFDYDRDTHADKKLNHDIVSYCQSFKIPNEIIWFKKDIENNFIGHTVKDKDKYDKASEFYCKGSLGKTKEKILSLTKQSSFKSNPESNVLSILSKYLKVTDSFSQIVEECIRKNAEDEAKAKTKPVSKRVAALKGRNKGKKGL